MMREKSLALLPEPETGRRLAELKSWLFRRAGGKEKALCLFGTGGHGRRLLFELRIRGVEAACFADNNPRRQGSGIEGLPCLSPAELAHRGDAVFAVVAVRDPEGVGRQLDRLGIGHLAKWELDYPLLETPPDRAALAAWRDRR